MDFRQSPEGALARIIEKDGVSYLRTFHARFGEQALHIPLSVIFNLVDRGDVENRFSNQTFPKLSDILLCRAFAATHLPDRPEFKENINPRVRIRVLLDENLSNKLLYPLTKAFNNLTHVYHERCAGETDANLFAKEDLLFPDERRLKNKIRNPIKKVIFSKDSDMTDLAVDAWIDRIKSFEVSYGRLPERGEVSFDDIPSVFQCCDQSLGGAEASGIYIRHSAEIKNLTYNGDAASYEITKHGVKAIKGTSFNDLIEAIEHSRAVIDITRGIETDEVKSILERKNANTLKSQRRAMWTYNDDGQCVRVPMAA